MHTYDVITMGRAGIDLYAQQVGVPFEEVESFAAYVDGSPANIAVGTQRLGLRTLLLTAVGDDPVGDFIVRFLEREGIETRFIPRKPARSGAVLLAMQPPDRFPLVHYRTKPADLLLDIDDVLAVPLAGARVLVLVGTNLSGQPSRDATLFAAEAARRAGVDVVFDLDYRADQWPDPRAYGVAARTAVRLADVVVGTQDEIKAAALTATSDVRVTHAQHNEARVAGDVGAAVEALLALGPALVVEKRGAAGARVHRAGGAYDDVPGFAVTVQNTLGAGDAFAAGFVYGRLQGWEPRRAARLGNACGALLVTRHACSASAPTYDELLSFIDAHGGL